MALNLADLIPDKTLKKGTFKISTPDVSIVAAAIDPNAGELT